MDAELFARAYRAAVQDLATTLPSWDTLSEDQQGDVSDRLGMLLVKRTEALTHADATLLQAIQEVDVLLIQLGNRVSEALGCDPALLPQVPGKPSPRP